MNGSRLFDQWVSADAVSPDSRRRFETLMNILGFDENLSELAHDGVSGGPTLFSFASVGLKSYLVRFTTVGRFSHDGEIHEPFVTLKAERRCRRRRCRVDAHFKLDRCCNKKMKRRKERNVMSHAGSPCHATRSSDINHLGSRHATHLSSDGPHPPALAADLYPFRSQSGPGVQKRTNERTTLHINETHDVFFSDDVNSSPS